MSKVFVDTNIFIYAMDRHDRRKMKKARSCLRHLDKVEEGVISTQVLQEFFVTATKKLKTDPLSTKRLIEGLSRFEIVVVDIPLVSEAIDISILNKISFWDALIVSAASSANCEILWSEDLSSGQLIKGVRIENPLG